jgi:membrane associated rhomboid family serine protease
LFPREPILSLVFIFLVRIPAFILLGYWFVLQFLSALAPSTNSMAAGGGVAVWAHIGGFLIGMVITSLFRKR